MADNFWESAPEVEVERPCCPKCRNEKYISIRGRKEHDGSITSRRICSLCGTRYLVISLPWKLPDSGKTDSVDCYDSGNKPRVTR